MFTVSVRDRIMIAHSFKGAAFGPAQALHGATFVVDVKFCGTELHPENDFLIDVCEVRTSLASARRAVKLIAVRARPRPLSRRR